MDERGGDAGTGERAPDPRRAALADRFAAYESDELTLEIGRVSIEPGRSMSEAAMAAALEQIELFLLSRLLRRWERTGEPPTALRVSIRADAG